MYFLENQPDFWAHEPNLEICNKNCDQAPEAELPGMDFDATNHQKVTSTFYVEILDTQKNKDDDSGEQDGEERGHLVNGDPLTKLPNSARSSKGLIFIGPR